MPRFAIVASAVAFLLTAGAAGAQARARATSQSAAQAEVASAPISDVRYEIAFDNASVVTRTLRVSMSFATGGTSPVVLSLPAWTPGAYEMSWFARWVSNFAPAAADGRALQWDKTDHDSWRIRPAGAKRITVRFDYTADTLDNAMSWSRPDFVLFNGTNVFLYPEGQPAEFAAAVTVRTEAGWNVATGMTPAAAPASGAAGTARAYTARNYHDLVDMPFFIGAFDYDSARVSGVWMRFASYPKGAVGGETRRRIWSQLTRMLPPQVAVFRDTPFQSYTVMQVVDSSFGGASGLEHQNSHVDVVTPFAVADDFMASLYAHEIFHAWNVKRLRPAELVPYRYDRPQPTPLLWVSEGITDYYGDLTLVRGAIVDSAAFLETTSGKINEVNGLPAVALEDASLSTWVHPTDGTGYVYYPKGSLAGLMLDIMIRDATDNRRSLDDVMRELYESSYKRGRGFTGAEWWAVASRVAGGRSFDDFNTRYVDGREPYPWATVLPLAGLVFVSDTVREPRLGVFTQPDSGGVRVTSVEENGAAMLAGVRSGDVLLAIGDLAVQDASFGERFRAKYGAAAEGSALQIQVRRGTQTLTLPAAIRFAVRTQSRITVDPKAAAKAVRIRSGLFHGTTAASR